MARVPPIRIACAAPRKPRHFLHSHRQRIVGLGERNGHPWTTLTNLAPSPGKALGVIKAPTDREKDSLGETIGATTNSYFRRIDEDLSQLIAQLFETSAITDRERLLRRTKGANLLGQASAVSKETLSRRLRRGGGILRGSC
jgi:hypothetical protein